MNVSLYGCLLHGLCSVPYTWKFALLGSIFKHCYANSANRASHKTSLYILVVHSGSYTCPALVVSLGVTISQRNEKHSVRTQYTEGNWSIYID